MKMMRSSFAESKKTVKNGLATEKRGVVAEMSYEIVICVCFCIFFFTLGYAVGFNRGYWKGREEKNEG